MDRFEPLHQQNQAFFTEGVMGAGRHNFFAFHMNAGAIAGGPYRDVDWQELVDRQQRIATMKTAPTRAVTNRRRKQLPPGR